MLDVDALQRADALWEREHLRLGEGFDGSPALLSLPDKRRVGAFLERVENGKGRRELRPLHGQCRPIADPDLVDLVEQVLRRVPGEDIRDARIHPHAQDGQQSSLLPSGGLAELVGAHVGSRIRHCHVEVCATGFERGFED
jgi:hypothetical protein